METATLMDECSEIDMKINSEEYLEEFRVTRSFVLLKRKILKNI